MRAPLPTSPAQVQSGPTLPAGDLGSSPLSVSPQTTSPWQHRQHTPVRSQSHPFSPRGAGGPVRPMSLKDLSAARQPQLSKFLDATVQPGKAPPGPVPLGPVVVPSQPLVAAAPGSLSVPSNAPASVRSASVQSVKSQPRPGLPEKPSLPDNALQLVVLKFEETISEQMEKLSSSLDASQEKRIAEISCRLQQAEDRWSQSLDSERLARESAIADGPALSDFAEFTAETVRDLTARMDALRTQADAAADGIAARKIEAVATIERLHEESLAKQQEQQQQQGGSSGSSQALSLPSTALQMIEGKFQEVMEIQIQKLTTTLSAAVERQVADVSGQLQKAEERWAGSLDRERLERRVDLAAALQDLESRSVASGPMQTAQAEYTQPDVDNMQKLLDAKFEALRVQTDIALAGLGDTREELTVMIRSATAELCGSLTQQQQQQQEFRRLRQHLQQEQSELRQTVEERCGLLKQTLVQQPEMTPQAPTPQAFENVIEVAHGLRMMKKELQNLEKNVQGHFEEAQLCKRLLESNREASESEVIELRSAVQAQRSDLDRFLSLNDEGSSQEIQLQVRGQLAEFARKLAEQGQRWSREAADLRGLTTSEVSTVKQEVQIFSAELKAVQTSVVRRVGEVCAETLQDWKHGRANDACRVDEQLLAVQTDIKSQSGKLELYARAVERLQLKCQQLPEPVDKVQC